jgi:hypothetical protein
MSRNDKKINQVKISTNPVKGDDIFAMYSDNQTEQQTVDSVLNYIQDNIISVDNYYVSGGTYSGGNLFFSGNSVDTTFTVDVSDLLDDTNFYVTGFTYNNSNQLTLGRSGGLNDLSVSINEMSGLTVNGNMFVSGDISGNTFYGDGSNLTGISTANNFVTGGTVSGTDLLLNRNDGGTVTIDTSNYFDSKWTQSGSSIYNLTDKIGIGTSDPLFNLDIVSSGGTSSFENITRFRTIDSTDFLGITNAVSTDGSFNPVIRSFNNTNVSTNLYIQSVIDPSVDTGVNPLIMLQGRVATDTLSPGASWSGVTTRPILRVRNNSDDLLQVDANGNVGIGTITPTQKLDVNGNTIINGQTTLTTTGQNTLTIVGSGGTEPLLLITGSTGELFSVSDTNDGSLYQINDASANTIFEVYSDTRIVMGSYNAPSLYATTGVTVNSGTTSVYSFNTSGYTGVFVDYTLMNTLGARAGNMMGIFSGSSIQYTETSTNDIGDTSSISLSMSITGGTTSINTISSTNSWAVKTIIRSI